MPSLSRSWFHLGAEIPPPQGLAEAYRGDAQLTVVAPHTIADEAMLGPGDREDGLRALTGQTIRREVWALDAQGRVTEHPIEVVQSGWILRCTQPAIRPSPPTFGAVQVETVAATLRAGRR